MHQPQASSIVHRTWTGNSFHTWYLEEWHWNILIHFNSLIPKMLTFILAISCLTNSNLPWFLDLTLQIPMQYCSLQHQTLFSPPETSTTGHCFCFGSVSSFLLELFLHCSLVVYWTPTNLGDSSYSVLSFCFFSCCSWGSQGKNAEEVCHSLLQWTTFCQALTSRDMTFSHSV